MPSPPAPPTRQFCDKCLLLLYKVDSYLFIDAKVPQTCHHKGRIDRIPMTSAHHLLLPVLTGCVGLCNIFPHFLFHSFFFVFFLSFFYPVISRDVNIIFFIKTISRQYRNIYEVVRPSETGRLTPLAQTQISHEPMFTCIYTCKACK